MMLREAVLEDADWTITLRNDEDSMRFSSTERTVTWEEHSKWFSEFLNNDRCSLYVVEISDQRVGVVRFEIKQNNVAVISIDIASKYRNKGFGLNVLNNALDKHHSVYGCNEYLAYIYPFNIRSIKLFEKAGFVLSSNKKIPNEYLKVMTSL